MAFDITPSGSFSATRMKVVAGEQADALWAQKLADNTGYVYWREIPIPAHLVLTDGSGESWYIFTKRASHNGLKIVLRGYDGSGGVTDNIVIWAPNADDTTTTSAAINTNFSYIRSNTAIQTHHLDISSLTDGLSYLVRVTCSPSQGYRGPNLWQTHSSGATY